MAWPIADVLIEGQALNSSGLTAYNTVEGLGLNTFGFLWPIDGIWSACTTDQPQEVTWSDCPIC